MLYYIYNKYNTGGGYLYLKIDFNAETPIYTQLRNQIVVGIASGAIKEGEALPSVRQMADDIGINLHTVNKAYSLLKSEGFINLDRRKGAIINLQNDKQMDTSLGKLREELKIAMAESFCKNVGKDEVIKLINEIYNEFGKGQEG
jgi:DNA-binding transcriptional regulator YhcF (GntR family)